MESIDSFISNIVLIVLSLVFSLGILLMQILDNKLYIIKNINNLEIQGYLESLIINRIKYAVESLDYNEEPLYYQDITVEITYDFEDVTVEYIYPEKTLIKYYHYDLKSKTLEIIN